MDTDECGLRFSDCAYYCSFSSDEDDLENDAAAGVFDNECEEIPTHECTDSRTKQHLDRQSADINGRRMQQDQYQEGSESDVSGGFVRFNGKNIKKLSMKDFESVDFATVDEAEKLYTYYSHVVGFSTRRYKLDRDRDGVVIRRGWAQQKYAAPRGTRYTRVCCPAAFTVRYSKERDVYYVSKFVSQHNHELATPEEVQFLRSHRLVKDHDIAQVQSLRGAQVHTSRAYEYLVDQAGGYQFVGFCMKDLYNKLGNRHRPKSLDGDAQSVVTWMNLKGMEEEEFYGRFSADEEGRLANLFWRDSQSLADYNAFGDVLIVDSTYKTNLYGKPLAVFVGCNNHRVTIVFGFALMSDEKEETYSWVFQHFLIAMKQKCPQAVLTDGDEAIRNVLQSLMPEARHRLCSWHIGRNIGQNVKDSDVQKSLAKLIFASLTTEEWEEAWNSIVAMNGLKNNLWVKSLYDKRERWAEAFFRGKFFGGMCSTQRCEGMHSKLKKEIGRYTRLCEVMPRLEKTLGRIRNRVLADNFRSKNCVRVYDTHMRGIEEQVCKLYTDDIFYDRPERKWCVEYQVNGGKPILSCSCKQYESDGIPCAHLFCVMKSEMMTDYPKSMVMKRWTKEAGGTTFSQKLPRKFPDKAAQVSRVDDIPNVPESNPNVLRDPPVAKTKGMHTNRTSNIESSKTEQRGCGICGVLGHNRRTCDFGRQYPTERVHHGLVDERKGGGEVDVQREEAMVNNYMHTPQECRVPASAPICTTPTSYVVSRPQVQVYSMSQELYPNTATSNDRMRGLTDVLYQHRGGFQSLLRQMSPSIGSSHLAQFQPFFSLSQGSTPGPLLSIPPQVQRPHSQPDPK
ncbi:hypothetical protein M0R45_015612 [Rubus argutus]|uniref:SWIM-type domain-containing protein n=1 Tax=Rubus argutus TaxID=59490 RepID=A0AAW1XQ59_RUBAR